VRCVARSIACVALLSPNVAAFAQQSAGDGAMRLGDLYAQVQHRSPRLYAARSLASAAHARVPGVTRLPDPQLQFGLMNYRLPKLAPMDAVGMVQLQLMQMIPLGGKLRLSGQVATAQATALDARADDAAWELRARAAMTFYDLYAVDRELEIARETLRLLQDIASIAEAMYRVGDGRQTDVLRAQVEIAKMTEDTLRMRAMRQSMEARLNAVLNIESDAPVGAPVLPRFPDATPPRAWLDSVAAVGRPMLAAGLDDVRAAEASEQLARRELIPDLQVGAQFARRGSETGTEHMGSLMISASIPIFASDRQLRMRDETSAMTRMAESDLAEMRADTRGKVGEAYAALTRARNLERLYRTTILPQADVTVASALGAYRAGTVDFMALLDSRMTVNTYRQELAVLESDEGKAWAELEMLTGRELIDASSMSTVGELRTGGAK
jgi:outer membrane protein TolC